MICVWTTAAVAVSSQRESVSLTQQPKARSTLHTKKVHQKAQLKKKKFKKDSKKELVQLKQKTKTQPIQRTKKILRKMELGKMIVGKNPKKEIPILLKDPLIARKWGLQKIKTSDAWLEFSKGNRNIVVAVIDTGVDVRHPDLAKNIWRNPREIPNNKKDDDNNGYVDDVHGWNFVGNNNKVHDTHGHGTHIAGIIGAEGGNGIGISGVAPRVSLMALKYYDPNDDGHNNLENTRRAIEYAVKNGAHIINYSAGGLEGNIKEKRAIQLAEKRGVLFVAAAGNERSNMDKKKYFPASYGLSNILSVTASNPSDQVLKSSNWGKKSVHTAAPGKRIFSTLPGGRYGAMTGTSQATAFATGAAVLVMDYYKMRSPQMIIKQLAMTGYDKKKKYLKEKTAFGYRLDIFRALRIRNRFVNSQDQIVDAKGKTFYADRISTQEMIPFAPDLSDLSLVQKALIPDKQKPARKPLKKRSVRQPANKNNRNPSSTVQQVPVLKRWSWKTQSQ